MGMRVLVVHDEAIVLKSCQAVLEAEGCEVVLAGSVAAALAFIDAEPPALLLVDVKMPVQDGMHLMRCLKQRGSGIPVVIMSGYPTSATIREAEDLGAVAFISKPFTPDELAATGRSVQKKLQKEEPHAQQENFGD
jgi:DNA-binding NtrC family response regulator